MIDKIVIGYIVQSLRMDADALQRIYANTEIGEKIGTIHRILNDIDRDIIKEKGEWNECYINRH